MVTLRPTMLQSTAGAALEFEANPEALGSKTTYRNIVSVKSMSNCLMPKSGKQRLITARAKTKEVAGLDKVSLERNSYIAR